MEIPFDKIKVNNAVIVFLIIVVSICFPLIFLITIDYKLFFDFDLTKVGIVITCFGFTQFVIVYVCNSLSMRLKYFKGGIMDETMTNFLLRNPLINAVVNLVFYYVYLICFCYYLKFNLKQDINIVVVSDGILVFSCLVDRIIDRYKTRKTIKS